ncbi:MAG: magnesium transporter [Archaeoglobus sp.]|nr:magnesium transporter [Archaeoglobus sp.]
MESYPYILIILPGLMGLRGNVFGALCSRLSTAFYLGSSLPSFRDDYVYKNFFFSIWASTLPIFLLMLIGLLKIRDFEGFLSSLQISITSSALIGLLLSLVSILIVVMSFKRSIDPDSISGPLITSIADIITIPSIVVFIIIFEAGWIHPFFLASIVLLVISIYFSRGKELKRIKKEVLSIITSLAVLQSITGSLLHEFSEIIYLSIFLSFAYPSIIDTLGNYGCIIVARTSTRLNLGEIEKGDLKGLIDDLKAILPTSILIFPFISLVPVYLSYLTLGNFFFKPIAISIFFASFVFLIFLVILVAFYLAVALHCLKIDPDNGGIPLITTIADLLGTAYTVAIAFFFIS